MEIIYLTHTARMKGPLLVRSDTPCASYHLGPIHEHTSIHPIPRITQDQLTHSCINPNTQTFPLLLDWKSENRTKRSAFLNKDACSAATFQNAAKTKLESSLDVQTRIQFGRPNRIQLKVQTRIQFGHPNRIPVWI